MVGLTGGVGAGKSTVAQQFAELAVPVIDADEIAREVVRPGSPVLAEVVAVFGEAVLQSDGHLDRAALRRKIFADSASRRRLEAILHPRIRVTIQERLEQLEALYCILVVPLLIETEMTDLVDRIMVIECDEPTRVARVGARDNVSAADVRRIMANQITPVKRLQYADDVLYNDGSRPYLVRQVQALHARYLALAGGRNAAD